MMTLCNTHVTALDLYNAGTMVASYVHTRGITVLFLTPHSRLYQRATSKACFDRPRSLNSNACLLAPPSRLRKQLVQPLPQLEPCAHGHRAPAHLRHLPHHAVKAEQVEPLQRAAIHLLAAEALQQFLQASCNAETKLRLGKSSASAVKALASREVGKMACYGTYCK